MKRAQKEQNERIVREKFKAERKLPEIYPQTDNQKLFFDALKHNTIVVGDGAAGTGKTLISCFHAAKRLHNKEIDKIILLRAYQPLAGRSIGLLPGTEHEKLLSTYVQMLSYLEEILGKTTVEIHLKHGTIEMCSLETIRGRNWENACIIVDEAQNLFVPEIQALTTRLGHNAQMLLVGDGSGFQSDVKKGLNGLTYLKRVVSKYNISGVKCITFSTDDILRSGITKDFVIAYYKEMESGDPLSKV